jgi:HEPN domain-containing protein
MSDADDMLAKARSDLDMVRRAMTPPTDQNLEQAAYHIQQAAEKARKALLVHLGIAYPRGGAKGHDLKLSALLIPPAHRLHSDANALVSLGCDPK